jgi:hypothetical protein
LSGRTIAIGSESLKRQLPGALVGKRLYFDFAFGGLRCYPPEGFPGQFIEFPVACLQMRSQLIAHALSPIFENMVADTGDCLFAYRLGTEKVTDVVGHSHQLSGAAMRSACIVMCCLAQTV